MSTPRAPLFDDDALELIASGVAIFVGTRGADLQPESAHGMGVRAHADRRTVTIYLPAAHAAATLANLRDNGEIAVTLCRPNDDKSLQVKGKAVAIRDSDAADRAAQEAYRAALVEQYAIVGIPRAISRQIGWWPSYAIDVAVNDVFTQTPGPHAGNRIAGAPA